MRFDYLTDDSELTLAPFFAPRLLQTLFNSVFAVGGLFCLCWPWHPLWHHLGRHRIPLHFVVVSAATLVSVAWIGLWCGCGEMARRDRFGRIDPRRRFFETERPFWRYGMWAAVLHTLWLIAFFMPFLLISHAVAGLRIAELGAVLALVFSVALFMRLLGFNAFLIWPARRTSLFWTTRSIALGVLFASAAALPSANPIWLIYEINRTAAGLTRTGSGPYILTYVAAVLSTCGILGWLAHVMVRRRGETPKNGNDP